MKQNERETERDREIERGRARNKTIQLNFFTHSFFSGDYEAEFFSSIFGIFFTCCCCCCAGFFVWSHKFGSFNNTNFILILGHSVHVKM